jgi:hypothetical protein
MAGWAQKHRFAATSTLCSVLTLAIVIAVLVYSTIMRMLRFTELAVAQYKLCIVNIGQTALQ